MNTGKRKSDQELIDAFAQLFDEVEPETGEEINEMLREAGYDPDEVDAKFASFCAGALYAKCIQMEASRGNEN